MLKLSLLWGIIIFFASTGVASAQVVINEFQVKPDQWIELYNKGETSIDISGWVIDDSGGTEKYVIVQDTTLDSKGCISFQSGKFNWSTANDTVKLLKADSSPVEEYPYTQAPAENVSIGRVVDGEGSLETLPSSTRDKLNSSGASCVAPIPTPTPEPTSAATATPTTTASPSPTKTATPTPTKSPTPKPTETVEPTSEPSVLALETSASSSPEESTNSAQVLSWTQNLPIVPIVLIILGVSTFVGSGVMYLRSRKVSKFERIEIDEDNNEIGQ